LLWRRARKETTASGEGGATRCSPTAFGLEGAREAGYLVLVEGESDCHTLWYHGVEALGVPGASNFEEEWAEHLQDIEKFYAAATRPAP